MRICDEEPTDADVEYVCHALGRTLRSSFRVAVRDDEGNVVVIQNPPFFDDGTPMPTLFWLVSPTLNRAIGSLEAAGGVNQAEADIGLDALNVVHEQYKATRDKLVRDAPHRSNTSHIPTGGVGGTRIGVKCLHVHYAYFLTGAPDPVGQWTHRRLVDSKQDGSPPLT